MSLSQTSSRYQLGHPDVQSKPSFHHWKWDGADWDRARFELLGTSEGGPRDWEKELTEPDTVHEAAAIFQKHLFLTQSQSVPNKIIKHRHNTLDIPPISFAPADVLAEWWCEEHEVVSEIRNLDATAAVGIDGISARTLKNCATELAKPIATLLNRCLYEGEFPACWKVAKITPIEKVSGTDQVTEFRPISALPVLSKIAEKWLKGILSPVLFANPDWNQFGFTAGRSAEDARAAVQ